MICVKNYTYPQQGEALLAQITDKACDFTGFVSDLSYTHCAVGHADDLRTLLFELVVQL